MGQTSDISWCDATWNPWQGCLQISPGCANCYMYTAKARYGQDPAQCVRSSPRTFTLPLRLPTGAKVFTASWSDFFIAEADLWRLEAWDIIRQTPHLTYQILTKRPERLASCLPPDWGEGWPHVWLGVSVENQRWTTRMDALCQIPAAVRFASVEPLLGPVDLTPWLDRMSWIIVGGESGPTRRPMQLAWLRAIVEQCLGADVACWVKQDAARRDGQQGRIPDQIWQVKQFPVPVNRNAETLALL
jgi:protein gp37